MNVLIVYGHPEPESLNGHLKNIAEKHLISLGYQVKVSDLHKMKWKAVAEDFRNFNNKKDCFIYDNLKEPMKMEYKLWILKKNRISLCGLILSFSNSHYGGLLLPNVRQLTAWLLIVFFILILPANIYTSIHQIDYQNGTFDSKNLNYLWFWVPLQLFFIGWCIFRQSNKHSKNEDI